MKTTKKIFGTLFFSILLSGATNSFAQQKAKIKVNKELLKEKMVDKNKSYLELKAIKDVEQVKENKKLRKK